MSQIDFFVEGIQQLPASILANFISAKSFAPSDAATNALIMSKTAAIAPSFLPMTIMTLEAPALPEPRSLMSNPLSFDIIYAALMLPIRYPSSEHSTICTKQTSL